MRNFWTLAPFLAAAMLFVCLGASLDVVAKPGGRGELSVAERRERVIQAAGRGEAGIPTLRRALDDENALVRRAALHVLVRMGAKDALAAALGNRDVVVRRAALTALVGVPSKEDLPYLATALDDEEEIVRVAAIRLLGAIKPPTDEIVDLYRKAEQDESPEVQLVAVTALSSLIPSAGRFHMPASDTVPLREREDMADHLTRIVSAFSYPLPRDGWKFRVDPAVAGHAQKWFEEDFDDSAWSDMSIERPWMDGYVGVGWYRRTFDLPERPGHLAAELVFEGVDESAWVWVNGVYVGGQDIGPDGWNQPFNLDVTQVLRWEGRNQITVRAMNTAFAGGIWRPIRLEALTLR